MATIVAQQAINGIVLGSLYVLVALGLTLIYGVLVPDQLRACGFRDSRRILCILLHAHLGRKLSCEHRRCVARRRDARLAHQRRNLRAAAAQGQRIAAADRNHRRFGDAAERDAGVVRPVPYAFETPYSAQVFRVAGTFFTLQSIIIIVVSTVTIALPLRVHEAHVLG